MNIEIRPGELGVEIVKATGDLIGHACGTITSTKNLAYVSSRDERKT